MQQHDLAGQPFGLAEIVRRHHHLDAARGDGAHDVLDRLGGGGIEAGGRLVEEQHAGSRASARASASRCCSPPDSRRAGPALEARRARPAASSSAARSGALGARHAGGGQRVTDIAGGAAPEHDRALEHDGAPRRRRRLASAPGDASARGGDKSHGRAQQRGLAGAVGSDQNGRCTRPERERNIVEDRHLAGDDSDFYEHDRQVGGGCAHAHPA